MGDWQAGGDLLGIFTGIVATVLSHLYRWYGGHPDCLKILEEDERRRQEGGRAAGVGIVEIENYVFHYLFIENIEGLFI